ncbi:hypothetical protein WJU16_14985 [Chitinophaga pollutisoli]|uniref:Uncharacterized protein n=1 Tax=Chitinophaga pollutisoli TaxID=3133966 RepID=A0ABZ2YI62_9BACT
MKIASILPALGLVAAICLTACKKKDIFEDNRSQGHMSMKLDGQTISVSKQLTGSYYDTLNDPLSHLIVSGLTADNQLMTINVAFPLKELKPGTYRLNDFGYNTIGWMRRLSDESGYYADEKKYGADAIIVLESISETKAKGTFSGILVHDVDADLTKTVTEGQFEVSVIKYTK